MLVVNLFGAPGAGKSTLALLIAGTLKANYPDVSTECPDEIAKLVVYDEAPKALKCQLYIAGRQHWQVARCEGHADIVVCDSPIMLSWVYGAEQSPPVPREFLEVCKHYHFANPSINYFVERRHKFDNRGRVHGIEDEDRISSRIRKTLTEAEITFHCALPMAVYATAIADTAAARARYYRDKNERPS